MLLGALVLVLHAWGLQGLTSTWPKPSKALSPVQIQLQMRSADPSLAAPVVANARPKPQPRAKPTSSTPSLSLSDPSTSAKATSNTPVVSPDAPDIKPMDDTSSTASSTPDPTPNNLPVEPAVTPPPPVAAQTTDATPVPNAGSSLPKPAAGPAWLAEAKFTFPASTKLLFEFVGESKGIRYSADGDIVWQQDGRNYQMRQEVRHLLLGSRSQTSVGALSLQGLQPLRFGDKYKQEQAAHFEREKNTISFSNNAASQAMQDGAQDRLSLLAQLASLMAGSPGLRQNGQQLQLQVASARSADVWMFAVEKTETLKLPIGTLPSLKLSRVPTQPYDQTIEVWLSPSHGYLPAKVRISQSNGDVLEQLLRKVETP